MIARSFTKLLYHKYLELAVCIVYNVIIPVLQSVLSLERHTLVVKSCGRHRTSVATKRMASSTAQWTGQGVWGDMCSINIIIIVYTVCSVLYKV